MFARTLDISGIKLMPKKYQHEMSTFKWPILMRFLILESSSYVSLEEVFQHDTIKQQQ